MAKTLKETLVRTTAVRLAIAEKVVDTVINHQFISMIEAMDLNNSVEMSGFGKFLYNMKKAQKHADDLERFIRLHQQELDNPNRKRSVEILTALLTNAQEELKKIKPKLHD